MDINDVLNEIQSQNALKPTNRALAAFTGIDEKRISEYRKGREPMDDDYARIAMASNRRVDELQAMVKTAEGRDADSREVWAKYYKKIGGYAASVMITAFAVVTFFVTAPNSALANQALVNFVLPNYKLCAFQIVRFCRDSILDRLPVNESFFSPRAAAFCRSGDNGRQFRQ